MHKLLTIFAVLFIGFSTNIYAQNEWVISTFGADAALAGNIQTFTAGEPITPTIITSNNVVTQGFQQPYIINDTIPPFFSGNAFTPFNADNLNDLFRPATTLGSEFIDYQFKIYDRWRLVIYDSADRTAGWNGTYNNQKCPPGAYVWVVSARKINPITQKSQNYQQYGTVHLIR